jgi:hypothetical protein
MATRKSSLKNRKVFVDIQLLLDNAELNSIAFEKETEENETFYSIVLNGKKFRNTSIEDAAINIVNEFSHDIDSKINVLNAL